MLVRLCKRTAYGFLGHKPRSTAHEPLNPQTIPTPSGVGVPTVFGSRKSACTEGQNRGLGGPTVTDLLHAYMYKYAHLFSVFCMRGSELCTSPAFQPSDSRRPCSLIPRRRLSLPHSEASTFPQQRCAESKQVCLAEDVYVNKAGTAMMHC